MFIKKSKVKADSIRYERDQQIGKDDRGKQ